MAVCDFNRAVFLCGLNSGCSIHFVNHRTKCGRLNFSLSFEPPKFVLIKQHTAIRSAERNINWASRSRRSLPCFGSILRRCQLHKESFRTGNFQLTHKVIRESERRVFRFHADGAIFSV